MAPARPLQRLLDGSLQELTERARMLGRLTAEVRRLAPEIGRHCRVANLRAGMLVIQVDSPAWATRLRYQGPALVRQLRRRGHSEIQEVRIQVAPEASPRAAAARRPRLSSASGELLQQTADAVEGDALRAALRRLAGRADQ